jgi:alpha-galactosidase
MIQKIRKVHIGTMIKGIICAIMIFVGILSCFAQKPTPLILTPKIAESPKINGAKIVGLRPGSLFLFRIPTTGVRPMTFSAENLPSGLSLDVTSGIISGSIKQTGEYTVKLKALNSKGEISRDLKIVVGDRIALTPPMGWAMLLVDKKEELKASADMIIKSGLADHGWTYINMEEAWNAPRDKFNDMKGLTDYIHHYGLKAGIYSSPGPISNAGYPGCFQREETNAKMYADWGLDYLKYDWGSYEYKSKEHTVSDVCKPFLKMKGLLDKTNRDIVYSIYMTSVDWDCKTWQWAESAGANSWRTGANIVDNWDSICKIGFNREIFAPYQKPGNWNNPDYLMVGCINGKLTSLTQNEQYAHFSLWVILSAPLLLVCDLNKLDDFTLSLLTNDEVIAIDQDPLGKQGTAVLKDATYQVIVKELEDGSKAVGLFNLTENDLKISAPWDALKLSGKQKVRDVWRQKDLGVFTDKFESLVPPHGVVFVKICE